MIIEIHKTPEGKNPLWVREAWVGLQLPSLDVHPVTIPVMQIDDQLPRTRLGALFYGLKEGYNQTATEQYGYKVNAKIAVGIVSLTNEEAAKWWLENVRQVLQQDVSLMFETTCCRPV